VLVLFGLAAVASADGGCEPGGGADADTDGEFDLDFSDDGVPTCDGVVVVEIGSGTVRVPGDTSLFGSSESAACDMRAGDGDDEAVTALQVALVRCNGQNIAVDGDYGPETTRAVTNVQQQHGIGADGAYGPATLQVMGWPRTGSGGSDCVTGVSAGSAVVDEEF
jgi:hypothetical protein